MTNDTLPPFVDLFHSYTLELTDRRRRTLHYPMSLGNDAPFHLRQIAIFGFDDVEVKISGPHGRLLRAWRCSPKLILQQRPELIFPPNAIIAVDLVAEKNCRIDGFMSFNGVLRYPSP